MPTSDEVRRRVRRRRQAGGAGRSGLSLSSGTQNRDIDIANDPEVEDLNEQLRENPEVFTPPIPSEAVEEFNPRNRLSQVESRSSSGGGAYAREYRLQLIHRMLMRRVPLDEIAQQLDISVSTVQRDRTELFKRLREEAKSLDINKLVGDTLGFYNEIVGMSMRAASSSKTPMNVRLAALRTALSARNDNHRFLQAAGIFDVLKYRAAEQEGTTDIEKLVELTSALIDSDDLSDDELEAIMPGMVEDEEEGLSLHVI